MKFLGSGWQYKVYDMGNGRVRKIPLTSLESFKRAYSGEFSPTQHRLMASIKEVPRINRVTRESIDNLKKLGQRLPLGLLGNPTFGKHTSYEQDFAIVLGDYLSSHSLEENKIILSKQVQLNLELWKYGFADTVFNFTTNDGVAKDGSVIHLDLGELCFKKEEVAEAIVKKKWLTQFSYTSLEIKELKDFYASEMDRLVTLENLQKYWNFLN